MAAGRSRLNRLSPPLMHVFREAHARRFEGEDAEAPAVRSKGLRVTISERDLRREVQRDLERLMNCVALESTLPLDDFPAVRRSVLNYGFPDLAHLTPDGAGAADLAGRIARALVLFEPRLAEGTVRVTRGQEAPTDGLLARFHIAADLVCDPQNVAVEFVADVEVQSGKVAVGRR